jgi:hypothetical protein
MELAPMVASLQTSSPWEKQWQSMFLDMLPAIERQVQAAFRYLPEEERAEAVQESLVNVCTALARLVRQGRAERAYSSALARYAVAQVRSGRQAGTRMNVHDVTSRHAQQKKGLRVRRLDRFDAQERGWVEAVVEDHRTPVADQVAFRVDFPEFLTGLGLRNRRIAEFLAVGHSTAEVARKFGLTAARVSQLRRKFHEGWQAFHGEPLETDESYIDHPAVAGS